MTLKPYQRFEKIDQLRTLQAEAIGFGMPQWFVEHLAQRIETIASEMRRMARPTK